MKTMSNINAVVKDIKNVTKLSELSSFQLSLILSFLRKYGINVADETAQNHKTIAIFPSTYQSHKSLFSQAKIVSFSSKKIVLEIPSKMLEELKRSQIVFVEIQQLIFLIIQQQRMSQMIFQVMNQNAQIVEKNQQK